MKEKMGSIHLLAIGFGPEAKFKSRIMYELSGLERQEMISILDLLFVEKDAETGDLLALDDQGKELGAIVGTLLGFEFEDIVEHRTDSREVKSDAFGLSPREIREIAALLDAGSTACFVLIEHVWARDLRRAIGETGGHLLGEGFLTSDAVDTVAPELVAMAKALGELENEEAGTVV
jgi:uncharacterized membrane protein